MTLKKKKNRAKREKHKPSYPMRNNIKLISIVLCILIVAESCKDSKSQHIKKEEKSAAIVFDTIAIAKLAQVMENNDYTSSEEKAYYDSLHSVSWEFKPEKISDVLKVPVGYVNEIRIVNPAKYDIHQYFSPYYDSVMSANETKISANYNLVYGLEKEIENTKVGIVSKRDIVKQARFRNKWVVLYTDSKYDDVSDYGCGYWIALSKDNGKHWRKYYTGLTQNCHYFFKHYSNIPLWKNDSTLQIESVIVRKLSQAVHPGPGPSFEVVKDGIAVQLNINSITKDSDHDGLTDVEEEKMMLNPKNPDTDGDKVIDSKDTNPRFKSVLTNITPVYIAIMEGVNPNKNGYIEIDSNNPKTYRNYEYEAQYGKYDLTSLIITNNKVLQHLPVYGRKMIVMTADEYKMYKKKYPSTFEGISLTRMFKCDKWKNAYTVSIGEGTSSTDYLVLKTKRGWRIIMTSSSIS